MRNHRPCRICAVVVASCGISGTASGKRNSKNRVTSPREVRAAKPSAPSNGKNRMQANVPSMLGSAISMWLPRGQMCRA